MDKREIKPNERTRAPIDRDGVIYTPSSYNNSLEKTQVVPAKEVRKRTPTPTSSSARTASAGRRKPQKAKSGFALFFIATIFVGMIVCVLVFIVMWQSMAQGRASQPPTNPVAASLTPPPNITDNLDKDFITAVGMITGINPKERKTEVLDIETNKKYTLYADGVTELKDKYGSILVFAEFKVGDVVEMKFKKSENLLQYLRISVQYWEHNQVSNATVNYENQTISYANEKYAFDGNTIAIYKDEPFDIWELKPVDLVTIRGYKDRALYVNINKRHGIIVLEKQDEIINGTVEIDTSDYIALDGPKEITVLEGRHRVVVRGNNIEPFTDEIVVAAGEKYKLNLTDLVFSAGFMSFVCGEPGVKLFVNGVGKDISEVLVLNYGDYVISAEKEGFNKFEKTVTLNAPTLDVEIKLDRIIQISQVTISTEPEGARIYVDNSFVGVSPVTFGVTYGSHNITIRKQDYVTLDFELNVNVESIDRNFILQSTAGVLIP